MLQLDGLIAGETCVSCGHSLPHTLSVQYKKRNLYFFSLDRKSLIFMQSGRRQITVWLRWAAFIPEIEMRLWFTEWNQFTVSHAQTQTASLCLKVLSQIKNKHRDAFVPNQAPKNPDNLLPSQLPVWFVCASFQRARCRRVWSLFCRAGGGSPRTNVNSSFAGE